MFYPNFTVLQLMFDLQTILTYLTLISVPVGVLYHILTLRNQSKVRQIQIIKGANLIGDYQWTLYDAEFNDLEDFKEKYGFESNLEFRKVFFDYFNILEELGVYVKDGLLDVRYVALIGGGAVISLWEKFLVVHEAYRDLYGRRWFVEAEYLYVRVKDFYDKHPELLK